MECNIILAGVGGQGILTIAHVISAAAVRRGWHVKQAEVHGMSQRGGAVYSHLRLADHPIHSDLVPEGECDLIVSMEPLEGLRYVSQLRENGAIISGMTPFVNIPDYPPLDELLDRVAARADHVLIDADRLARLAGAALGANSTLLGACVPYLAMQPAELEEMLCRQLQSKGRRIVDANRKAYWLGYHAAEQYRDGLSRGAFRRDLRNWSQAVSMEELLERDGRYPTNESDTQGLSAESMHAMAALIDSAYRAGRTQLREHEVYRLIEHAGAITPPKHVFIPAGAADPNRALPGGGPIEAAHLDGLPGEKVVVKLVSPDVVHKSDSGGVLFVRKSLDALNDAVRRLWERQAQAGATIDGVLLVEFVEHDDEGFGKELFVGVRASRAFGPVIVAGVGGIDTEYLAERMRPGAASAKALATETSAEAFFELFKKTAAYDVVAGIARGHRRVVSDGDLVRCFRAFIGLARAFCVDRGDGERCPLGQAAPEAPSLLELEINPFAFVRQKMVPLDGRGRLGHVPAPAPPRPQAHVRAMLEPDSIALVGVSAQRINFARVILSNIIDSGFPIENVHVIHPEAGEIDGVRCIRSIKFTAEPIDMLVAAVAAENAPRVIEDAITSGRVRSIVLIPGGLGETEGSDTLQKQIQSALHASRSRPDRGPVVLGGNCLGVRSRPGRYDTFFVPAEKLDPRYCQPASAAALVTQSGAFAIARLSNLESINPAITVTVGNQTDLTISDIVRVVGERDDIAAIGVYVEGFNVLDGLELVRVVREVSRRGKTVVFYKAGRTPQGRSATAGHTASIAGDYDVCRAVLASAGAIVVDTFKEFEQLIELATLFHSKNGNGGHGPLKPGVARRRIAGLTNAGAEAVGMADTIRGPRYHVDLAPFSEFTEQRIQQALTRAKLDKLVTVANPLDVNPMADEDVYTDAIEAMLDDPNVDAVVVSLVPFTPHLLTTPTEINNPRSLAVRLPEIFRASSKPLLVVVDAGRPYDVLARTLRQAGVPVFPTCDQAIRSLGRYLDHFSGERTADTAGSNRASPGAEPEPRADAARPDESTAPAEPADTAATASSVGG